MKTRSSPVISKIFLMFRSLHTSDEPALLCAEPLDAADEHAERRRVDERRVREVDDDVLATLTDHVEELLLELGRGVQVDLARERDHVGRLVDLLCLARRSSSAPPTSARSLTTTSASRLDACARIWIWWRACAARAARGELDHAVVGLDRDRPFCDWYAAFASRSWSRTSSREFAATCW